MIAIFFLLLYFIGLNYTDVHLQGSLDGLCSVYAVLNSTTLLAPQLDAELMFTSVISHIGDRLLSIMLEGMSTSELRRLALAPCIRFCARHGVALRYAICRRGMSLSEYWQTIQDHCGQHGPGSIILGIGGACDHWTCVSNITEKTIMLADSQAMRRLYRRYVTIDHRPGKYSLRPIDTFLMTIS
jgi:hypothetical protein